MNESQSSVEGRSGLTATRWASLALVTVLAAAGLVVATVPTAAAAATIGSVQMSGDSSFDSDSLADNSATQYRWQSYPGARLTMNPDQASDVKTPAGPEDSRLSLNLGGWFGTSVTNFNSIVRTEMAAPSGTPNSATSVATTWYPYKIGFASSYATPSGTTVGGYDFMKDADSTVVRVVNVSSSSNSEVALSGAVTGSGGAQWIGGSSKVVIVTDDNYYYAIHVVSLTGSNLTPVELTEQATISGSEWTFRKAFSGSGNLGVSVGFAAKSEGSTAAVNRALGAFNQPVATTISQTKAAVDGWLRQVPAPTNYGISGVATFGVTAAQHKAVYYSSWAFILQDLVNQLPENSSTYPYPQMMTGKPSLWNVGSAANPGTSQWESAFGDQMLSFVMPEAAWQSYLGLMAQVGSNGQIGGESLPTRLGETAWILYQQSPNSNYLSTAYTSLKRFLNWSYDNPRWICCGHDIPEEKDMEYVASWLYDTEFAIKIATQLEQTSDVTAWQNKRAAMIQNITTWGFFKDADVIYNNSYPYTTIPPAWGLGNDSFKATAISISGLPTDQMNRVKEFFMSIHRPDTTLDNFYFHKYPDVSLMIRGLLNNGGNVQAQQLAQASMRDVIRGKQPGEVLIPTNGGGVKVDSVAPSIFTAAEAIDFTWILNGMRIDNGAPQAFTFDSSSLTVPNSPDAVPTLESFNDISDWTNPYNAFLSATGGSGVVSYVDVAGGNSGYGYIEKQVSYNVTDHPSLTIDVGAIYGNGKWALKVNNGGSDITVQADSTQLGLLTYDLPSITGWSGAKTFKIRLFSIGGEVKVREISTAAVMDNFDSTSGWVTSNATMEIATGIAKITSTSSYGRVKKTFQYNVDTYPNLTLEVTDVGGGSAWSIKVDDGGAEIPLQADTSSTGVKTYNLKNITGWTGLKTVNVSIYAINNSGAYLKVNSLSRS